MVEMPVEAPRQARAEAVPRRPALGYAMVLTAATLWGFNGTVTKVILDSGVSSLRLAELRSSGAAVGLAIVLALTRPAAFRVRPREWPLLVFFGVAGLSLVQWLYFEAIHRLNIGIALLLQYVAPLLVALWARFVYREHVRRRLWAALVLALVGLTLVLRAWAGLTLDGIGVAAALGGAGAYALYVLVAEHGLRVRDPVSLTFYGFLCSAVFWAIVQPWWGFPARAVGEGASLGGRLAELHLPVWALVLWMIVLGTIVPFLLLIGALRHVSATRAGILAMLEPVVASVVAFAWLGETLTAIQLAGGCVVLTGILLAQSAR
jgi:drug/metabolite transporter (DMT)-like permease